MTLIAQAATGGARRSRRAAPEATAARPAIQAAMRSPYSTRLGGIRIGANSWAAGRLMATTMHAANSPAALLAPARSEISPQTAATTQKAPNTARIGASPLAFSAAT